VSYQPPSTGAGQLIRAAQTTGGPTEQGRGQTPIEVYQANTDPQSLFGIVAGILPDQLPNNSTSNVLEASHVVAAGESRLVGVSGFNSKASAQFIQVHDKEAVPADGAVPVIVVTVPASSNFSIDFGSWSRWFYRGIVVCNSSTAATKTIGSADCFFDCQFI
jgi:hypothetical protein